MVSREHFADGSCRLSANGSQTRFHFVKPGVVVIEAGGMGDAELGDEILREFSREVERAGHLQIFADLSQLARIPTTTRDASLEWGQKYKAQLRTAHVLVGSKLVEMTLSVIGMFLGGLLEVHGEARQYQLLLARELPEFAGFSDESAEVRHSQRMTVAAPTRPNG